MTLSSIQLKSRIQPILLPVAVLIVCLLCAKAGGQSASRQPPTTEDDQAPQVVETLGQDLDQAETSSSDRKTKADQASSVEPDRSLESLSRLLELTERRMEMEAGSGSSVKESADDFRQRNDARIESIHERILLIRQLIDQKKTENVSAEPEPFNARHEQPETFHAADSGKRDTPHSTTSNDSTNPLANENTNPVVESQQDNAPAATSPNKTTLEENSDWGNNIATEPVDSFELATSLFMTGNYEGAIKTCLARLQSEVDPEQKAWLQCMIGCSHRILGDYPKAEASFREVTNNRLDSYPVDYARWNLGYIRQRQEMQTTFEAVASDLDAMIKEEN